ncbi:PIN domain-like protein [Panaeolus papilionaceus]|nr:PIN domain-like protein [Panaeolus papilionaceus]
MGIPNLWKAVQLAGQTKSLEDIVASLPILGDRDIPCIGVDLGPCMDECIAATMPQGVNGRLPGGPLYVFFHKLVAFLHVRATFVFVFDGPAQPKIKRGHQVRHNSWWEGIVEELIVNFGFRAHHAPGEAEAELAMLNRHAAIDAVLTSDSDVLVFGASQIIRPVSRTAQGRGQNEYEHYTEQRIQERTRLTHGGVVLFALLSGGDYNNGVDQCGPRIALGLARSGFGEQLVSAVSQFSHPHQQILIFSHSST